MPITFELNEQSAQNKKHDIKHEQTFQSNYVLSFYRFLNIFDIQYYFQM